MYRFYLMALIASFSVNAGYEWQLQGDGTRKLIFVPDVPKKVAWKQNEKIRHEYMRRLQLQQGKIGNGASGLS